MKISKKQLNAMILEEIEKIDLLGSIMSAIDDMGLEDLEKLAALMDTGGAELEEGVMGGIALGVAGATVAAGVWELIKLWNEMGKEDEEYWKNWGKPRTPFANDPALQNIRQHIQQNIDDAHEQSRKSRKNRRPPGDPPQDSKQAIMMKKLNHLKSARGRETEVDLDEGSKNKRNRD